MGFHKFNYWFRKLKKESDEPSGFVLVDPALQYLQLQANYDLAQAGKKVNTDNIRVLWQTIE